MNHLFDKNLSKDQDSSEDFSELLPLADICNDINLKFEKPQEKSNDVFEEIITSSKNFSPLESLKKDMLESVKEKETEKDESLNISTKSSLLEKCLPFIYDEDGEICIEDKPDYTLESVDDIINSAEKRAKEKIAKLYNLQFDSDKKETAEPTQDIKDEEDNSDAKIAEKLEMPTQSDVLLDDFTGKRTVVTPTESVTTTYSKLTVLQNSKQFEEEKTQVLPDIKPTQSNEEFEDILSHTKQINIQDIPSAKKEKPEEKPKKVEKVQYDADLEDYLSFSDAKKIGVKLKRKRRSAFLRLAFTVISTLVVSLFALPFFDLFVGNNGLVISFVMLGIFSLILFLNLDIFISLKNAFTSKMTAEFPTAICLCVTELHLILSLVSGNYHFKSMLPALFSLIICDYFKFRKTGMVLNNFKLIIARREKNALALIDDVKVTSLMARSSIEGDVLAAGQRRTAEISDFLKNTSYDNYLGGHLSIISAVILGFSFVVSIFIGVTYNSFDSALCGLSLILSIFAMPSLMCSEFLPIIKMSAKLFKMNSAIFGKHSAGKIEQINAAVVNSNELFPKGAIELFNMHPLGSSNIDEILKEATAVAAVAKSPLESVFKNIIGDDTEIPFADSVKYEDNLGISGWVGDHNFHIGNRTLMEAHSIRVPSLEVDKKILHKGYFPVYVACDQRACALLIVKYSPDEEIQNNLIKLVNTGVTLLVNNCDPNITEEMLCDYYSIYPDSVKIMDHIGSAKYKNAVNYQETTSAHAFTNGDILSYLTLLNYSIKLRKVSAVLLALYIITAVICAAIFALVSLNGSLSIMSVGICLLIQAVSLCISLLGYSLSA
ncbi:MAG: hypothetical protein IJP21_05020 [Clostridia bacterium]|nr:hypothetical protein [Clostridia bacterium]